MAAVMPMKRMSPTLAYVKPTMSEIRYGRMSFLITDRPTVFSFDSFIKELRNNSVGIVVRVCEPTYDIEKLRQNGIRVMDWEFPDGTPPSRELIDKWLEMVLQQFDTVSETQRRNTVQIFRTRSHSYYKSPMAKTSTPEILNEKRNELGGEPKAIAVHCISGLGRAPLLVAIALVEAGMPCEDVIFLIRTNRRGALNETQLNFLRNYKATGRLRKLRFPPSSAIDDAKIRKSCGIM